MLRKPLAACEFYFALQFSLIQFNADSNEFIGLDWWWRPWGFLHDQFDSLETFATLFVVTIANADQARTIKLYEF
jgi:hypothetical protein